MFKNIFLAVVASVAPLLYTAITGDSPDFPLTSDNFIALLVWLAALPFGGSRILKAYAIYQQRNGGSNWPSV